MGSRPALGALDLGDRSCEKIGHNRWRSSPACPAALPVPGPVPSGGVLAHLILEETDMNLKLTAQRLHAGGALAAGPPCGACAATTPPLRQAPVAETATACSQATLGVETVDASRVLRRQRGIPEDVHGAMIVEVLAGGPAARAGLLAGDVVERLALAGADRAGIHEVNGYFDFDD